MLFLSMMLAMLPQHDAVVIDSEERDPLWGLPQKKEPTARTVKCGVKGCPNDAVSTPILLLLPMRGDPKPLELQVDYKVCEQHQNPSPNAFITKKAWQKVQAVIVERGWERALWKRTTIRFDPLPQEEVQNDS